MTTKTMEMLPERTFCTETAMHRAERILIIRMRFPAWLLLCASLLSCGSNGRPSAAAPSRPDPAQLKQSSGSSNSSGDVFRPSTKMSAAETTRVWMHNVMLNEKSGLNLRVRWLRGRMIPTHRGVPPSFDEPGSFALDIEAGVLGVSLTEVEHALNDSMLQGTPLQNVTLAANGRQQIKLTGTLHKAIALPIEMIADLGHTNDGRIHLHVEKLRVLKLPVKGMLEMLHVKAGDLIASGAKGIEVHGDDVYFDPQLILPEPQKRGTLTDVHIGKLGDVVSVYGSARPEVQQVRQWRNFIELHGGTLGFGKIIMRNTDIVMIDTSNDAWFNFDLAHYQEQLVNGYTRMTPQAGLQIFMPDINKIPRTKTNRAISLEWIKNRNIAPPVDIVSQ